MRHLGLQDKISSSMVAFQLNEFVMIKNQVLDIISRTINVDKTLLTDDLSIGDIAEWDSVGNLAIIAAIEEEMQLEIPLEELFEMTSIESIVAEVKKLTDAG